MNADSIAQTHSSVKPTFTPGTSGLLQRDCACRQHIANRGDQCKECKNKHQGLLQRSAVNNSPSHGVPLGIYEVLSSPSQPLDAQTRAFMQPRFGHDFSRVRVHSDAKAAQSAARIGAHAYTVAPNLVFSSGMYRPYSSEGRHLLAHELAHIVQQENSSTAPASLGALVIGQQSDPAEAAAERAADLVMGSNGKVPSALARTAWPIPAIQCDLQDPQRFQQAHEALFVHQPGASGSTLLPWVDPGPGIPGTANTLFQQAKPNIQQYMAQNPASFGGTVTTSTTEATLDADALDVNQQIHSHFPMIRTSPTETQIRSAVSVMTPALTSDRAYQRQWLANRLPVWCDIERYNIGETDPRYETLLDRLLDDPDVGSALQIIASRSAGFQRGEGQAREIFIHRGTNAVRRRVTLFHELTHYYSNSIYRDWVATTTNERWYNEGFTEYLARLAMPAAIRAQSTSYQDRWNSINAEVAAHVSDDDIARAYFLGEVWRIETRSAISRREAGTQLGLRETATAGQEMVSSRQGPGINQTVVPGRHYRFMNIGFDNPSPKPEHLSFFREVKSEHLDQAPILGVRFVGHASTAGPSDVNDRLSLQRAQAFYSMAQGEAVAGSRLIDAANPPHQGESLVTATEEDPATRAFNRRVEMFLLPVAGAQTGFQDPGGRRGSRVDVATAVQAKRPTFPNEGGGLLTQALLARLRNQRVTVSTATATVGAGNRTFGSAPASGEERTGISVGRRASAAPGATSLRRAVVIGNAVYKPGTTMGQTVEPTRPLPGSLTDANRIAAALAFRGYDVNQLDNQTATDIEAQLNRALVGLAPGSELFFFYSGHGTPEGLIGVDGIAFTPAQMLSIRNAARTGLVNLIINTDACHDGIFADAIRGAELRDTRLAASAAGGSATSIVAMLDEAIAVQDSKDVYNTAIQAWWAHRYELEAAMSAPPQNTNTTADQRTAAWTDHYQTGGLIWNDFVTRTNPLLNAMRTTAASSGITLRRLTLKSARSPFDSDGELLAQAGLDDVDTLTNQVLAIADTRLP